MRYSKIKNSIGKRLTLYIAICFLIPYIIVIFYINSFLEMSIKDQVTVSTKSILSQTSKYIDKYIIGQTKDIITSLASDKYILGSDSSIQDYMKYDSNKKRIYSLLEKDINRQFKLIKDTRSDINFFYLATEDGKYIEYPKFKPSKSYDPRLRPWYIESMKKNGSVNITPPYVSSTTGDMVIGINKKITFSNGKTGVIGMTLQLVALYDHIEKIKLGRTGQLMLIDTSGTIILSPFGKDKLLKKAENIGIPFITQIPSNLEKFTDFTYKNTPKVVYSHKLPETGWYLAAIYNKSELWGPAYSITSWIMLIFSATLVIAITTVYFTVSKTSKPLIDLIEVINNAEKIEILQGGNKNNFSKLLKRNDEFGFIARAMTSLIFTIKGIISDNPQKMKEYENLNVLNSLELLTHDSPGTDKLSSLALEHAMDDLRIKMETEHKLVESAKALKTSEERLSLAFETSNDAFFDLYPKKNAAYVNTRFIELFDLKDFYGEKSISQIYEIFFITGLEKIVNQLGSLFGGEVDFLEAEEQLSLPSKSYWVKIKARVVESDEKDNPARAIGTISDITDRKEMENVLRKSNDDLELNVAERTTELMALNQELQAVNLEMNETNTELANAISDLKNAQDQLVRSEKLASLSILVAGVAHEINTPIGIGVTSSSYLNKINTEFVKKYKDNSLKLWDVVEYINESSEAVDLIHKNLGNASRLVNSLKNLSTDLSNEMKRLFNVKSYIDDTILSMNPKFKHTKHRFVIECDDSININSYPGAFSQILTNLALNSLTHAFHDEKEGIMKIDIHLEGDDVLFEYSDNGDGIPDESLPKIFDPFYTTKRGSGGTGLGLFVVHNIVTQQFGGTIQCISEGNKGTRFIMKWPNDKNTI